MGYANTCGFSRLGMVIPKKSIKQSVARNILKRRIRGYFYTSMSDYVGDNSLDCVVVATKEMKNHNKKEFGDLVASLIKSFVANASSKQAANASASSNS